MFSIFISMMKLSKNGIDDDVAMENPFNVYYE